MKINSNWLAFLRKSLLAIMAIILCFSLFGQTVTDVDGNVYNTITIGTQTWMAENLKTTKYRNGDTIGTTIPEILNVSGEPTAKYQWAYQGNEGIAAVYGRLYTWNAITDSRNVCPTEWHVPSDAEWTVLSNFLGGENIAGGKVKEAGTLHWAPPNTGATNESGFNALPGGIRGIDGLFSYYSGYAGWWSSTEIGVNSAWYRNVVYNSDTLKRDNYCLRSNGFSVRCLKDSAVPNLTIKFASKPAVEDGIIDASDPWLETDWIDITKPRAGNTTSDMSAKFQLKYDDTNLYFAAIVNDASRWTGNSTNYLNDCIEFYIAMDTTSGVLGTYKTGDRQLRLQAVIDPFATGGQIESSQGVPPSGIFKCVDNGSNYVQEWTLPWAELSVGMIPAWDKKQFKFDIQVANSTGEGLRTQQMFWNNNSDLQWNNTSVFGLVTLESALPNVLVTGITVSATGGSTTIGTDAGSLQMSAAILPLDATTQLVNWTVTNGTGRAIIRPDGLLTARMNGSVTVRATALDGTGVFGEYMVTISNQIVSLADVSIIKNGGFATDGPMGGDWGTWSGNGGIAEVIAGVCAMMPAAVAEVWQLQVYQTNWMVYNDSSYVLTFTAWAGADRSFNIDLEDPNNSYTRFGSSTDPESIGGRSDWIVPLTTSPTTFTFHTTIDAALPNTKYVLNIMTSGAMDVVYIDNISLVSVSDTALIQDLPVAGITVTSASGAATIETVGGTLQMTAAILPADATNQAIKWTATNGTGKATIGIDGLLTALSNGTVTVTATSKDGSNISASREITISNQFVSMIQTIENFESLRMNLMDAGANGSLTVVPNPDPTGANTSSNVVEFRRGMDGQPWAGFYGTLTTPVDFNVNKYIHVKVWKTRLSPVTFKIEGGETGNIEIPSMNPQTVVNGWEELVFDFSAATGNYTKIVLSPDREDPLTLTEDITLYFDDLTCNNDPGVGSAAVQIMEDYENIPINLMLGASSDSSSMSIFPNPYLSDYNPSSYVAKFLRDKDGVSWGGFWSQLPGAIDVTTDKFIHVKVWKPRLSPLKFKIEGGAAGTLEVSSRYPQTKINEWEDIVFDFSEKTGTYPIIAFMPDYEDYRCEQ
jgi:uncharacterized protein (TIGR02145 family)